METISLWTSYTRQQLQDWLDDAFERKRVALNAIALIPATQRTFENTISALEHARDEMADLQQYCDLVLNVHPDAQQRSDAHEIAEQITTRNIELDYDRRIWVAVNEWWQRREVVHEAELHVANDVTRELRRMGFECSAVEFERLKHTTEELERLETSFEAAINDWNDGILVTEEELDGLPADYKQRLHRQGTSYRVSLDYPEYFPFLRYATSDEARKKIADMNLQKGGRENLERLSRMISLRQQRAQLLGYSSHAAYVIEPRMAKTPEIALRFLDDLISRLQGAAAHELQTLEDFQKTNSPHVAPKPLSYYSIGYWSTKVKEAVYQLDGCEVRSYFPLPHVLESMLALYQRVLSLTFRPHASESLWHEDVMVYEVFDGDTSKGYFALDLFPREGKYGHAAVFPIRLQHQTASDQRAQGFVALVCNFPRHSAATPSLLEHEEVETLFHEFGHVLHALVSGNVWQRTNGFGVALDFVESISQLFEEWVWDVNVLESITKHVTTGLPMPLAMRQQLAASRRHMVAYEYLQQALKARYDLLIHSTQVAQGYSPDELANLYRQLTSEFEGMPLPETSLFPAGWGHMSDYDAGYYGYLWSKAYALEMYSEFHDAPLDPSVGKRLKEGVIRMGALKSELTIVQEFLGRAPTSNALLSFLGFNTALETL